MTFRERDPQYQSKSSIDELRPGRFVGMIWDVANKMPYFYIKPIWRNTKWCIYLLVVAESIRTICISAVAAKWNR